MDQPPAKDTETCNVCFALVPTTLMTKHVLWHSRVVLVDLDNEQRIERLGG